MLNDMCGAAETPYIANWDCDVIVPPMQLLYSVELLRKGVDMVYPYHGGFARMPRMEWLPKVHTGFDIGVVRDTYFKHREASENSVGGAVLWNKEAFIDAGMENEYMISFGPEDVERYNRARKLNYYIKRVNGPLFHMNHNVGVNSSPKNPYFYSNVEQEKKVNSLSVVDLRAYVDSWPWRHPYTTRYYADISEGAIRSAKIVMEALPFQPTSVIDVGCGVGEWSNGHPLYIGIDYRIDKSKLLFPVERYVECNLNREFPELHFQEDNKKAEFSLAICLEVAEHLHPSQAEPLVEYLCSLSDKVLFSAAIPYQGGNGHVNEQWQEYWAELFYKYGFGTTANSIRLAQCIVYHEEVELWYRQNMVLYERDGTGRVTNFVLPEYYEQIVRALKA
jgi:SAM-dependent methyltransferase